jgi:hypothetical protein
MFAQKLLLPALAIINVAAGKSSMPHLPQGLRLHKPSIGSSAVEYVLADAIMIFG